MKAIRSRGRQRHPSLDCLGCTHVELSGTGLAGAQGLISASNEYSRVHTRITYRTPPKKHSRSLQLPSLLARLVSSYPMKLLFSSLHGILCMYAVQSSPGQNWMRMGLYSHCHFLLLCLIRDVPHPYRLCFAILWKRRQAELPWMSVRRQDPNGTCSCTIYECSPLTISWP